MPVLRVAQAFLPVLFVDARFYYFVLSTTIEPDFITQRTLWIAT
jgi:hypothetical protein